MWEFSVPDCQLQRQESSLQPPDRYNSCASPSAARFKPEVEGITESLIPGMSVKAAKVLLLHWAISANIITFCCGDPVDQEPSVLGATQMQKNVSVHPPGN